MLQHGYAPNNFIMSSIVPIPKGVQSNLNCSENYRPIAISSLLDKVFDKIILSQQHDFLFYCSYQFGFKPHSQLSYVDHCSLKQYNSMYMTLVNPLMICYSMHLKNLTECAKIHYLQC